MLAEEAYSTSADSAAEECVAQMSLIGAAVADDVDYVGEMRNGTCAAAIQERTKRLQHSVAV